MTTNLQALADRAEIEDLVHRLGASLDERRFDDLRGILVEGATARTPGGLAEGRDAMVVQAERNHPVEDRTATRPHMVLGEVYRLHARRTAAGWRLSSVETEPVWATEPTAVDLAELFARRPAQRA